MCQAQSPQSQVRRRVRDAAQAELNGVDGLVQEHVRKIKLGQENKYETYTQITFHLLHSQSKGH